MFSKRVVFFETDSINIQCSLHIFDFKWTHISIVQFPVSPCCYFTSFEIITVRERSPLHLDRRFWEISLILGVKDNLVFFNIWKIDSPIFLGKSFYLKFIRPTLVFFLIMFKSIETHNKVQYSITSPCCYFTLFFCCYENIIEGVWSPFQCWIIWILIDKKYEKYFLASFMTLLYLI